MKETFRIKGTTPELVGSFIVNLTTKDIGVDREPLEDKLRQIQDRIDFLSMFELFNVDTSELCATDSNGNLRNSKENLVNLYKKLQSAVKQWIQTDVTMHNVATLTFHSYDSGAKGYLSEQDLSLLAHQMFSFMGSKQRAMRILDKWQENHDQDQDDKITREEFVPLVNEVLKDENFVNPSPVEYIGDVQEIALFEKRLNTLLKFIGHPRLYHAQSNPDEMGTRPLAISSKWMSGYDRSTLMNNLSFAFFVVYRNQLVDDVEPGDSINTWRMSIVDFYEFIGATSNKLKNSMYSMP